MNATDLELFIKSIIIGFSIAVPVGPIAILCINRTLSGGKLSGLASGFGAASADFIYGTIVAFGLTFVSSFLTNHRLAVRLTGGIILIALGLKTFLTKPSTQVIVIDVQSLIKDFISTFLLTLSNPLTIFAFFATFAAFNIHRTDASIFGPYIIILGIFTGSFLWWTILTQFVGHFYKVISAQKLKLMNIFSGIVIMLFGLAVLIELALKISKIQ